MLQSPGGFIVSQRENLNDDAGFRAVTWSSRVSLARYSWQESFTYHLYSSANRSESRKDFSFSPDHHPQSFRFSFLPADSMAPLTWTFVRLRLLLLLIAVESPCAILYSALVWKPKAATNFAVTFLLLYHYKAVANQPFYLLFCCRFTHAISWRRRLLPLAERLVLHRCYSTASKRMWKAHKNGWLWITDHKHTEAIRW